MSEKKRSPESRKSPAKRRAVRGRGLTASGAAESLTSAHSAKTAGRGALLTMPSTAASPPKKARKPARGVFERPAGVWWISYRDREGKRHREKIGERYDAADALRRRQAEIREGRFAPPRGGSRLTFGELARKAMEKKWIRVRASSYAQASYRTDQIRLRLLLPILGERAAGRISPTDIEGALETLMRDRSICGGTANRSLALISAFFSFGVRNGLLAANPASRVKRFRENPGRLRWLRPEEEAVLRAAFESKTEEAEFDLAINTGMRRGEQFHAKWENVDWPSSVLMVTGKSGRRPVVLNSLAIAALRRLQQLTGGEEFITPGGAAGSDRRKWFRQACQKAGIKNFRWHDLRHTFASRLVMGGVDIRTVQELLGHKSIVMTQKYSHLSQDHRHRGVETLADTCARMSA